MADMRHTFENETWRDVPGWGGIYSVSSLGRVRSEERTRQTCNGSIRTYRQRLISAYTKNGYPAVDLKDSGRVSKEYVHRLVCRAYHGEPEANHEVAHGDGNKANPAAINLRWATREENLADRREHGTHRTRDNYAHAKIRSWDLRRIRDLSASGMTASAIARQYNVTAVLISRLLKGTS